ncbi:MAG TPA: ATP-binding cassette domain-containing protein [Solimonas sp.]|nr:ATP-binding cassette domain-containing protein [Solimonas sp.]
MLTFANATLRRGSRTLLENLSFTIYPGHRVGVVGRNGTGKSSLFAMLLGQLSPDLGEVSVPKSISIATVAQETPPLPQSALDFVLDGDQELRATEAAMARAEASDNMDKLADLYDRMAAIDGYAARARAARMLDGLGFSQAEQSHAVADFSGGWRMRLNLGRALMCRSDLLMMDEPTNHLDLDAVLWLQDWLTTYPGTLLTVSHDREFLDAATTHTLHLQGGGATLYSGNYSQFERLRAERLAQQQSVHEQQKRQVAHLQSFVDRFKAGTKARQAQARVKMIERIHVTAAVVADPEFQFSFPKPERMPSPLIHCDKVSVGYGERTVLSGVKVGLEPGDRIGLLGPNGAGKSTFVRLLAGELEARAGTMTRSPYLRVGYFAQHQVEHLDMKASPILHLQRLAPQAREQSLRDFLGSFNFRGDRAYEAIEPFSGGEKARLALALVVYGKPNLLLLDEPTNHLDLDMRQALEMALQDFAGSVVLVSHDRHLVASTCDELWRVSDGEVVVFDGDLDDYARWLSTRRAGGDTGKPAKVSKATASAAIPEAPRGDPRVLRETIKKLDAQMAKLQQRLAVIEKELVDPALYDAAQRQKLQSLTREQGDRQRQLQSAEEEWLTASSALEKLQA